MAAQEHHESREDLNEVLFVWKAPSHPFKERGRVFYQAVLALTILLSLIVFFLFHEILPIIAIILVAFIVSAISKIPPVDIEHKILPIGFDHAGKIYRWNELTAFWFDQQWDSTVLVIQTRIPFPTQLRAVIPTEEEKGRARDMIGKYLLLYEKPQRNWMERTASWLSKKIPLDTTI